MMCLTSYVTGKYGSAWTLKMRHNVRGIYCRMSFPIQAYQWTPWRIESNQGWQDHTLRSYQVCVCPDTNWPLLDVPKFWQEYTATLNTRIFKTWLSCIRYKFICDKPMIFRILTVLLFQLEKRTPHFWQGRKFYLTVDACSCLQQKKTSQWNCTLDKLTKSWLLFFSNSPQ